MGMFSETANIVPFTVCGPRKTNIRFLFLFTANKRKSAISVFRLHKANEVAVFR
jgi:hypothetical protein